MMLNGHIKNEDVVCADYNLFYIMNNWIMFKSTCSLTILA